MKYPKVAIIIINWNGWQDTIECLESLYQIDYPNYNVIVVDNGSSDDSIKKIKEYCEGNLKVASKFFKYNQDNKPLKLMEYNENTIEYKNKMNDLPSNEKLTLIKATKNYGFAGGNNIGINYTLKASNIDYLLLLNNDIIVDNDFLSEMIKVGESDEKIGFVGSKTYYYNRENNIQMAGGAKISFIRAKPLRTDRGEFDHGQYDKNTELDYINGACLLCKKDVAKQIGLLDTKYFLYWEETDWCMRGRKLGYKSVYAFKSKIWHKVGNSSQTPLKIYYHNRNRVYFVRKHANRLQKLLFQLYLVTFYFWFMTGYYLVYRRNKEQYLSFFKGINEGFKVSMTPPSKWLTDIF